MRKLALLVGIVLLAGMPALAQDYPKGEFYAGYAFHRFGDADVNAPAGFSVQYAGNFNANFGVAGDFGYARKSPFTAYSYLGGIRFASRGETATGFGHALFGGATIDAGGLAGSVNGIAMGFGGGVDVKATDKISVRGEVTWIPTRISGVWNWETVRIGGGVVFKIGQ